MDCVFNRKKLMQVFLNKLKGPGFTELSKYCVNLVLLNIKTIMFKTTGYFEISQHTI